MTPGAAGAGGLVDLLPPGVACSQRTEDPTGVVLFDSEAAVVAGAVDRRRREFATVRLCAREALASIGFAPIAVLPGPRGAPQWPPGVVGSMTHCQGYRAAAVSFAQRLIGVGVDAEPDDALPASVRDVVLRPTEEAHLRGIADALGPDGLPHHWDRLVFSGKESVFKLWYPLTGRELGFQDVELRIEPRAGRFTARLLVPVPGGLARSWLGGRWTAMGGVLVSAVTCPRRPDLSTTVIQHGAALPKAAGRGFSEPQFKS